MSKLISRLDFSGRQKGVKDMKRAVAYMRMSTDKQEHSIDSQWRLIKEYADRNGFVVLHKYEDEGISGRAAEKRPAFMQMIDDSESGDFETVLIYDSSRFARNLKDAIVYKALLKQNGVDLISITEPILDEDNALITDALMGAMNEMYVRKLSKNVRRGMEQRALRGEYLGHLPFGYEKVNGAVSIVPNESKIIEYIYDQYIAGRTSFSLAKEMRDLGIKTKSNNLFDNRQIDRIITNPIYAGTVVAQINGKEYRTPNALPSIIDQNKYDAAQKVFNDRKKYLAPKSRPKETHKHWLCGKIRCGKCGATYYRRENAGRANPQFLCTNYMHGRCKSPPVIAVYILEGLFFDAVAAFLATDEKYAESQIVPIKSPVEMDYESLIAKLERALKRAREAYLAEIDSLEEYQANKTKIESEISRINLQKEQEEKKSIDTQAVKENVRGMLTLLKNPDISLIEKCGAVERTINRVILNPDRSISVEFFAQ